VVATSIGAEGMGYSWAEVHGRPPRVDEEEEGAEAEAAAGGGAGGAAGAGAGGGPGGAAQDGAPQGRTVGRPRIGGGAPAAAPAPAPVAPVEEDLGIHGPPEHDPAVDGRDLRGKLIWGGYVENNPEVMAERMVQLHDDW
jgi:hypothetical protein